VLPYVGIALVLSWDPVSVILRFCMKCLHLRAWSGDQSHGGMMRGYGLPG
jgi:hypothetical protein